MSCIVGFIENGTVYMGADSAGISGYDLTLRTDKKIFEISPGPFLIGFTTSFRMGQLLRYRLADYLANSKMHEVYSSDDCMRFMVCDFIEAVRKCLKDGGCAKQENNVEVGGQFLVGWRGRLFCIDSDYQVGCPLSGFAAIGCGAPYALGVLYATGGQDPEKRILSALEAAEYFSGGVRRPFVIKRLEAKE